MLGLSKPVSASGSLRVLAALLGYPDAEMRGYLPEMRAILRGERALSADRQELKETGFSLRSPANDKGFQGGFFDQIKIFSFAG